MATAITILFSLLIITDVVNSNMIFELKHKYDALPPQESMIARWQNDQRRHGRSLSSVDVEVGAMGYMDTGSAYKLKFWVYIYWDEVIGTYKLIRFFLSLHVGSFSQILWLGNHQRTTPF